MEIKTDRMKLVPCTEDNLNYSYLEHKSGF